MKKWIRKLIIGDEFYYVHDKISMLDNEVRKVRKEIVDLRNEILLELVENKSLLKQILEQRKIITDVKNNIEIVKVESETPVIKRELPDIPDKEVKIVKPILTQEAVKELFEYRDGDLYWKIDIYTRKHKKIYQIKIGDKAGTIRSEHFISYKVVTYQYKKYKISRLIFLMFYGYLPQYVVYKDGNTLNTRIENLLEANASQVSVRKKLPKTNITGYRGVHFNKCNNKYQASIGINNKTVQLGYYNTAEEASKAYEEAKLKYYGTFLDKCKVVNG